jgi:hypothetical protein
MTKDEFCTSIDSVWILLYCYYVDLVRRFSEELTTGIMSLTRVRLWSLTPC